MGVVLMLPHTQSGGNGWSSGSGFFLMPLLLGFAGFYLAHPLSNKDM